MTINKRFIEIIEHFEEGNRNSFCRRTGIKPTTLSGIVGARKSDPSAKILNCVLSVYPIDAMWFVTGRGEMLLKSSAPKKVARETPEQASCSACNEKDKIIQAQNSRINELENDKTWMQKHIELLSQEADTSKRNSA